MTAHPALSNPRWYLWSALILCAGCAGEINTSEVPQDTSDMAPSGGSQVDMKATHLADQPSGGDDMGVEEIDQGVPEDMSDPYVDLMKCDDANFWPVDTPLRQLTPVQLYRTLEQAFYPDGDPRIPAEVHAGTRSLEHWVHNTRSGEDSGLIRTFPEVEWSEDSFTNRAQTPTALGVDGYARFASWFLGARNSRPMSTDMMYGTDTRQGWSPCRPDERNATRDELIACGAEIVDHMLPQLIRRPLADAEERQAYIDFMTLAIDEFYDEASTRPGGQNFTESLSFFFRAILQTPQVIYRTEYGTSELLAEGQATPLDDFELANRLSFFFWNAPPDQTLWELAESGQLRQDEVFEAQARRLLADPRSRETINAFFSGWLKLEKLQTISVRYNDPNVSRVQPDLPEATTPADCDTSHTYKLRGTDLDNLVASSARQSVLHYIDWAFWEEDSFEELMSGDRIFSNHLLSRIYQWPDVPIADIEELPDDRGDRCTEKAAKATAAARVTQRFELVTIPDGRRRGVLTQPGMMAMSSHDGKHSPILRGVHLLNSVLCQEMGFPADLSEFNTLETEQDICTTRDYITLTHTATTACQSCHGLIDGLGFSFEHYDKIGAYVNEDGHTKDRECAVDSSTTIPEQTAPNDPVDIAGSFNDAAELAPTLASSDTVKACMVAHWLRFAHGRKELAISSSRLDPSTVADAARFEAQYQCQQKQIRALARKLDDHGGSMQELVISLVMSPSFRLKALDPTLQGGAP